MKAKQSVFPKLFSLPAPVVVALLACLLYAPTIGFEYTQDDAIVLSENIYTQEGIAGIPGLWTNDTFYGFFQEEGKSGLVSGGRYRPFTPTLFAIEGGVFGLTPAAGHIFNILYSGLLVSQVYIFIFYMGSLKKQKAHGALWGSLLFLAHPIHTEVVCNIKGRDEIVAFAAALGAILVLWKSRALHRYILSFFLFSVAMFSKENAVVFLMIGPSLLFLKGKKQTAKGAFFALATAFLIYFGVRYAVLGKFLGADPPRELMNNPFMVWNGQAYEVLSFVERIPTVLSGLLEYLRLMIWPWPLTHDYYPLQLPIISFSDVRMYLSLFIYVPITIWAIVNLKAKNIGSWGWLWFIIALFPMSNIAINVGTFLSERFLFIPSMGFILFFIFLLKKYGSKVLPSTFNWSYFWGVIFGIYVLLSLWRMPAWQSNFTLFTTDVITSSNSAKVNNATAGEYNRLAGESNNVSEQAKWAEKSKPYSRKAIDLHPTYKNAFLQQGNAHFYLKDFEKAISSYEACLQLDPNYADALNNLALAYRAAGQYYGEEKQDLTTALRYLRKAYELQPSDYETLRLLGVANGVSGRPGRALEFFKKALKLNPNHARAYYDVGSAYMQKGRLDSSQLFMNQARDMDPSLFESKSN